MKIILVTNLVMSLLWQGCHSFNLIEKEDSINLSSIDQKE